MIGQDTMRHDLRVLETVRDRRVELAELVYQMQAKGVKPSDLPGDEL